MAEYIKREDAFKIIADNVSSRNLTDFHLKCNLLDLVNKLPAADVQPAKHGWWSGYSCSNCGISKYNFISFNIVGEKEYARPFGTWNYCPRCGAKMDGEA